MRHFIPEQTFLKKITIRVDKYLTFASLRRDDQRVIIYEKQAESFDVGRQCSGAEN